MFQLATGNTRNLKTRKHYVSSFKVQGLGCRGLLSLIVFKVEGFGVVLVLSFEVQCFGFILDLSFKVEGFGFVTVLSFEVQGLGLF